MPCAPVSIIVILCNSFGLAEQYIRTFDHWCVLQIIADFCQVAQRTPFRDALLDQLAEKRPLLTFAGHSGKDQPEIGEKWVTFHYASARENEIDWLHVLAHHRRLFLRTSASLITETLRRSRAAFRLDLPTQITALSTSTPTMFAPPGTTGLVPSGPLSCGPRRLPPI